MSSMETTRRWRRRGEGRTHTHTHIHTVFSLAEASRLIEDDQDSVGGLLLTVFRETCKNTYIVMTGSSSTGGHSG